ncbi:MAG: RNA 3'-terminal phosphate cyclase [Candidatus Methanomethylophilaceae archaeon]|nr:RNA 3'-terminal phosphate cyclase [Candidatus Methanomethylophilaceae archaeon]MDD3378414.1 RNA 3'-terminal phosphate cyclase [Candidatus Methanomethylophilaceae archaeon]MDY0223997.1 RNA 3'-terminal phosphate cyclase [Candidatus Methanomethylophilaceae archaeon]
MHLLMLEIDSSRGEGGGQMVRTSVALSALTGIPTKLTRIRENRPTNGLSKQHTTAINAVAMMTGSKVEGNTVGSSDLIFEPGNKQITNIQMDIGTAGSISLVLQAALLAAKNYKETLTLDIIGGTNVMWAPPLDSYELVLFPLMKRMDINARVDIVERGFYPLGGGHVIAKLEPIGKIQPLELMDLGELKSIKGRCFVQHLPERIGNDMMTACKETLAPEYDVDFEIHKSNGISRGAGLVIVAEYENGKLSSNVLTSRGHSAEQSGIDAANDLLQEISAGSTVDVHTADQLLPYMAMAEGRSGFVVSRISKHLLSQMDTLESFLDVRFGVERKNDGYHFTVSPGEGL